MNREVHNHSSHTHTLRRNLFWLLLCFAKVMNFIFLVHLPSLCVFVEGGREVQILSFSEKFYFVTSLFLGHNIICDRYIFSYINMTDHAGPARCECHPGTNFRHPPIELTQFWRPFFLRPKRLYWSRGGVKVWNKSCWKWSKSNPMHG